MSPEDWWGLWYKLARHLPGLGGVASYESMELPDVLDLAERLRKDLEREAEAYRKIGR